MGWAVDDQLVIGPSGFEAVGWEKVTIASVDDSNSVTLKENLAHFHYGHSKATVTTDTSGIN